MQLMTETDILSTDRISEGGNAIASDRLSVCLSLCPSVCFHSVRNRLTADLELLQVSTVGHDQLAGD